MIDAEVAFLVFLPPRTRRAKNTFDGNSNIGASVIADLLHEAGIKLAYCPPELAHEYRLVLVSLTSSYDVLTFYRHVALLPAWQKGARKFKVLAGGAGMQNPVPIRNFVDYAFFGRAESAIVSIVSSILGGGQPDPHPSLMFLPDVHPVRIAQAETLLSTASFVEEFVGCPLKCKFCHYTYARKHIGSDGAYGQYVQKTLTHGDSNPELTWDGLFTWGKKFAMARVAIDGSSERLRYIFGKRITNDDIVEGINVVGSYYGTSVLNVYNIGNFPTETRDDIHELYKTLARATPKARVVLKLHTTPFRPTPATPMQWERATLLPDWSKTFSGTSIVLTPTFDASHDYMLESAYTHLVDLITIRATPDSDRLFHVIAFSPSLKRLTHERALRLLEREFDLTPYLREYELDEPFPLWFLEGYISNEVLRRAARHMREELRAWQEGNWRAKGVSIVQARLRRQPTAPHSIPVSDISTNGETTRGAM